MINLDLTKNLPDRCTVSEGIAFTNDIISRVLLETKKSVKDMTSHLQRAGGKGIRTTLLLHCALDEEGNVPADAILAAAAIEILHLATLVHDDIIDDANLRRGIESVQSKFGKKDAVICGDYLFCLSFYTISSICEPYSKHMLDFSRAISKICLGELRQHNNNQNVDLSLKQYMHIISGKTAALFWFSAYAGAIIGGSDEKDARTLARFGQYLGLIFQMIDDCKDYELSESKALKTVNNDILQGVITLPLIMSFMKDPALKDMAKDVMRSKKDVSLLVKKVHQLDGINESKKLAGRYGQKAQIIIDNIENIIKREALSHLLMKALRAANQFCDTY